MDVTDLLKKAVENKASDVFIIAGLPVSYRINGRIIKEESERLMPPETESYLRQIYALDNRDISQMSRDGDDDFSFAISGLSRFRVNAYKQRGAFSAVVRVISFNLPNPVDIMIPQRILEFGRLAKGMVLVTGPAGSGKTTTLACVVDYINQHYRKHIITLEDPIEYLHSHGNSIISQREINIDTKSYLMALRASLRQSPDVILLGEMRDYETMEVAMTAAETGHLIFSTLHTIGAANTIDRIIDVFPANQQRQIAVQLSMVLQAIISQQLVPTTDGGVMPVFEIMTVTPAIRNMIRDNKVPQIDAAVYSSNREDMVSMDMSLFKLYQQGHITRETALAHATNSEMMARRIRDGK